MKKGADFAFSVTPYLGEQRYDDDENYRGYEKYPYFIKYLTKEQTYDIPKMNLDAPAGTCIWQVKADWIDAEDNREDIERRYKERIKEMKEQKPLPDVIYEIKPPKAHDYC